MKTNRRHFIKQSVAGGLGAASLSFLSGGCASSAARLSASPAYDMPLRERYDLLDTVLKLPVLRRELFPSPVIIHSIEYLRDRNNFLCRVRSRDGAEGMSAGHGSISARSFPVMQDLARRFTGQDARNLDELIPIHIHGKSGGIPYNVQLATLEFAILDMLGNTINRPIGHLLGDIHNPEIPIYQGTQFMEQRALPPEESIERIARDLEISKARAIKMRAGISPEDVLDSDLTPGHSVKLATMARERFGDEMVLMCDGNNHYSVDGAIRMGKILDELNYYWWEEPVPYAWNDEQKMVKDALSHLKINYATGESEAYTNTFRWLIANDAVDILQHDTLYFGGMIRATRVNRMAAQFGKTVAPHITNNGLGYLYMLQLISATPNPARFQEFQLFTTGDANGNQIPIESKTEPFVSIDGVIKVPTGAGLGLVIDPEYVATHRNILDLSI